MTTADKQTAVITGGNRGIGADITRRFLDAGYRVVNVSRQVPEFEHEDLQTIITDLADREQTASVAGLIASTHSVSVFVHNAGVIRPDRLEAVKLDDLDYLSNLHLGSAISLAQHFLPAMQQRHYGRIVLISSRGVLGLVGRTSYAATKAGQIAMVRTWALELADSGITVNCVAPGPIETDMLTDVAPHDSPQQQKIIAGIPVGRLGTAADVGRVVEFLCDEHSSFITGQTWYVCGGASLGSLSL